MSRASSGGVRARQSLDGVAILGCQSQFSGGDPMPGWLRLTSVLASAVLILATDAQGYNGGPLRNVTDLTPTCAGCHSSIGKEQLRVDPEAFAATQLVENKHYKAIEEGVGGYKDMSPADRQK